MRSRGRYARSISYAHARKRTRHRAVDKTSGCHAAPRTRPGEVPPCPGRTPRLGQDGRTGRPPYAVGCASVTSAASTGGKYGCGLCRRVGSSSVRKVVKKILAPSTAAARRLHARDYPAGGSTRRPFAVSEDLGSARPGDPYQRVSQVHLRPIGHQNRSACTPPASGIPSDLLRSSASMTNSQPCLRRLVRYQSPSRHAMCANQNSVGPRLIVPARLGTRLRLTRTRIESRAAAGPGQQSPAGTRQTQPHGPCPVRYPYPLPLYVLGAPVSCSSRTVAASGFPSPASSSGVARRARSSPDAISFCESR